jgi:hypothetical protein
MKRFEAAELSSFDIATERLQQLRLKRIPTWSELYRAVNKVVQDVPPGLFSIGCFTFLIPEKDSGGRCPIYSCFTWGALTLLLRNALCLNVGRIQIKILSGPKGPGVMVIPPQGKPVEIIGGKGAFHAWCLLERFRGKPNPGLDDAYVVDFAYTWFQQMKQTGDQIAGPANFIVQTPSHLAESGIIYVEEGGSATELLNTLELNDLTEHLMDVFAELRKLIN